MEKAGSRLQGKSASWQRRRKGIGRATVELCARENHPSTPTMTCLIVAVGLALGQWLTLLLPRIPPGREPEAIVT